MKHIDELTINLIYLDGGGKQWDCGDMLSANGGELMRRDGKGIEGFTKAKGGIELVGGGGETIYSSTDFMDMEIAASFLMFGLSSLELLPDYLADSWEAYVDEGGLLAELQQKDGSILELRRTPQEGYLLIVAFEPGAAYDADGASSYFMDVVSVPESVWVEAALTALDTYFHAAKAIRNWYPDDRGHWSKIPDLAASWITFRGG